MLSAVTIASRCRMPHEIQVGEGEGLPVIDGDTLREAFSAIRGANTILGKVVSPAAKSQGVLWGSVSLPNNITRNMAMFDVVLVGAVKDVEARFLVIAPDDRVGVVNRHIRETTTLRTFLFPQNSGTDHARHGIKTMAEWVGLGEHRELWLLLQYYINGCAEAGGDGDKLLQSIKRWRGF
jgi:hypothetical protein